MTTQRARRPRDGSKIDLQSLHARFNQVSQISQCLRIAIESKDECIEPAEVCRAIVDLLDDINSDLWTFLEPSAARRTILLRKSARDAGNGAAGAGEMHLGGAHDLDAATGVPIGEFQADR